MLDSLTEALPPLPPVNDDVIIKEAWVQFSQRCSKYNKEQLVILECRKSMESTSIASIAQIVAYTPNVSVARKCFFELVKLAATRADLTAQISRSCSIACKARGFPTLSDMANDDIEFLMKRWLTSGLHLRELPLLLCDSAAQEELLDLGIISNYNQSDDAEVENHDIFQVSRDQNYSLTQHYSLTQLPSSESNLLMHLDLEQLHIDKVFDFLEASAPILIPLLLGYMAHVEENSKNVGRSRNGKDKGTLAWYFDSPGSNKTLPNAADSGFTRLSEFCSLAYEGEDDERIASALKDHLHNIYGYAFPLIQEKEDVSMKTEGRAIMQKLAGCMDEKAIDRQIQKVRSSARYICRRYRFRFAVCLAAA